MTLPARPPAFRCELRLFQFVLRLVAVTAAFLLPVAFPAAAEDAVTVELNDATTVSGSCHASFVVRNNLSHTLDRFQLDLYVFDGEGVIKSRSNIDLAPLQKDKSTVFTFRIFAEPCAAVSKVLLNDIPMCRAETGAKLDCLAGLTVSSRNRIEFAK